MAKFQFRVRDTDPNTCTVTIESKSKETLHELIDDVGLDSILNDPKEYNAIVDWDEELHQPMFGIVDHFTEVK